MNGVTQPSGPDEVQTNLSKHWIFLQRRIADFVRVPGTKIAITPNLRKISAKNVANALKKPGVSITAWDEYLLSR